MYLLDMLLLWIFCGCTNHVVLCMYTSLLLQGLAYMWPICAEGMFCVLQELARLQKLVQLPLIQEAVKDKFSKFDADLNPTHDHEGNQLDTKVLL